MTEVATPPAVNGPLHGLRVIDLSINVLGPVATQILGDMGADVIKAEPPEGDQNRFNGPGRNADMSVFYLIMNRNKRSIRLNLKQPACLAALYRLVESADVLVHSMRPSAAERLGIGYQEISARNPKIIYAHAPGYRGDGPYRDRPAFDDVVQGESGLAALNADEDGNPRYLPTVIVDKFCGYVLASSISMALYHRERTGIGQLVQVPMLETMLQFNLFEHLWEGALAENNGKGLGYTRMFSPQRRPYPTRDGYICVLAVSDQQWRKLLSTIGHSELLSDERFCTMSKRMQNIGQLYAVVADSVREKTTAEWKVIFDAADIPNGPVRELDEMMSDEYLAQTGFFQRFDHPTEGPIVMTSIPQFFSASPGTIRHLPPNLGEHGEQILREAGFQAGEITRILAEGEPCNDRAPSAQD